MNEADVARFVEQCRDMRNGSPNSFYHLVDDFCKAFEARERFCAHCHRHWTGGEVTEYCGDCHRLFRFLSSINLTNHHNALTCPYCNPRGLKLAEELDN